MKAQHYLLIAAVALTFTSCGIQRKQPGAPSQTQYRHVPGGRSTITDLSTSETYSERTQVRTRNMPKNNNGGIVELRGQQRETTMIWQ